MEIARTGRKASTKHEVINKRGQVLQAFSTIFPGDAPEGRKPTFLIAQTRLLKYAKGTTIAGASSRPNNIKQEFMQIDNVSSMSGISPDQVLQRANFNRNDSLASLVAPNSFIDTPGVAATIAGVHGLELGRQDQALASDENLFDELKTTRSTSWQFELRQMEKQNRFLAEELQGLLAAKKKRKRRKGAGSLEKECTNCHTRVTPEWRRGPSGNRDLCNSCGLRYAKQQGRISPRTTTSQRSAHSAGSGGRGQGQGQGQTSPQNLSPDERDGGHIDGILAEKGIVEPDGHVTKSVKTGDGAPPLSNNGQFSAGVGLATMVEEEDAEDSDDGE